MSDFHDDAWYDARWESLPRPLRDRAVAAVTKAIAETDLEKIRAKHALHGRDWIHHLIDVSDDYRAKMDALLPADAPEEAGWPATMSGHHGFGTAIRNLLRDPEDGAEELPPAPYEGGESYQNWDDYYVAVLEAAAGLRS